MPESVKSTRSGGLGSANVDRSSCGYSALSLPSMDGEGRR